MLGGNPVLPMVRGNFGSCSQSRPYAHTCSLAANTGSYNIKTVAHRVPELIRVLGSQPAGDVSPTVGCHYFPPGLQLPSQPPVRAATNFAA